MNVWVVLVDDIEFVKVIIFDELMGILSYYWVLNLSYILYFKDMDGDEDFYLYLILIEGGEFLDLILFEKILVWVEGFDE